MSTQARIERWQRLRAAGVVEGELADALSAASPWYIGALLGIAAWLAALFLLFFIGLALEDVVKKPAGALACGIVVTLATSLVLRRSTEHTFVSQLAIAFSLAGQGLVLAGLMMEGGRGESARWLAFALFETLLVAFVPHAGHRVLAALGAAAGVMMALAELGLQALFVPIVTAAFVAAASRTLSAARDPQLWQALALALVLALLGAMVFAELATLLSLVRGGPVPMRAEVMRWVAALAIAAASGWAGSLLVKDATGASNTRAAVIAGALLAALALVALALPGVAALIVVLLLAYAIGQPVIATLAVIGLVAALGHYYYRLDTTLLTKAGGLLAIGLLLLIARAIVVRLLPLRPEARHA